MRFSPRVVGMMDVDGADGRGSLWCGLPREHGRAANKGIAGEDVTRHKPTLGAVASSKLLDYGEWMKLCRDLRLLDAVFTRREATLCFVWSRLSIVDESDAKSRLRLTNLAFEE